MIRFDALSDALSGKPIALFINYPVHAVVMGPDNYQLSGDLAGATSRFVENYYRGDRRISREVTPVSRCGFRKKRPPRG